MGAVLSSCKVCFGASEEVRESYTSIRGSSSTTVITPDPDERRRQLAEAAEKRLQEQEHRGVKNLDSVRRQQQRKEEMERKEEEMARQGHVGEPTMKWQMS